MTIPELYQCGDCLSNDANSLRLLLGCGHVLCESHLKTEDTCSLCGSADIDTVPINQLPPDCQEYFEPLSDAMNNLAAIAAFQQEKYTAIMSKQQADISRLQAQVEEQKRVMRGVRDEMYQARELQGELERLRAEVAKYSNSSTSSSNAANSPVQYQRKFNPRQPQTPAMSTPFRKASGLLRHEEVSKSLERFQHPSPKAILPPSMDTTSTATKTPCGKRFNEPHRFQQLNRKIRTSPVTSHIANGSGGIRGSHGGSTNGGVSKSNNGRVLPQRQFLNRVSSPTYHR